MKQTDWVGWSNRGRNQPSPAHRQISLSGAQLRVTPKTTAGAKMYHANCHVIQVRVDPCIVIPCSNYSPNYSPSFLPYLLQVNPCSGSRLTCRVEDWRRQRRSRMRSAGRPRARTAGSLSLLLACLRHHGNWDRRTAARRRPWASSSPRRSMSSSPQPLMLQSHKTEAEQMSEHLLPRLLYCVCVQKILYFYFSFVSETSMELCRSGCFLSVYLSSQLILRIFDFIKKNYRLSK